MTRNTRRALIALIILLLTAASAQAEIYHHYFGSTHAHSRFSDGKENPADHFRLAKAAGYDFYAITDHALARLKGYTPENYETTKREADEATDSSFIAIAGFEFSENDGPDGRGHLNALNTATTLDATGPKVTFPVFYDWLVTEQSTKVAASFNHPGKDTYNSYGYLTPARRDCVTMFELFSGNSNARTEAYLAALNKGWRLAPIASLDAHGTQMIAQKQYRTGVLAPSLTRESIMQAMRTRRVYATWDRNLRLTFRANGEIMGSVIREAANITCSIRITDPDTRDAKDLITRIEFVGENGKVCRTKEFSTHTASWNFALVPTQKYYFVQVYCADKTDGPTAYSSPIWIENPVALRL